MIKLTKSMKVWMLNNHPDKLLLLQFGHTEIFTKDMETEYLNWCKTEDGKKYLQGGELYEPPS